MLRSTYRSLWADDAAELHFEGVHYVMVAVLAFVALLLVLYVPHQTCLQLASESFGFFSLRGVAAWTVAGVAAYLYIVLPAQKEEKQTMVRAVLERAFSHS